MTTPRRSSLGAFIRSPLGVRGGRLDPGAFEYRFTRRRGSLIDIYPGTRFTGPPAYVWNPQGYPAGPSPAGLSQGYEEGAIHWAWYRPGDHTVGGYGSFISQAMSIPDDELNPDFKPLRDALLSDAVVCRPGGVPLYAHAVGPASWIVNHNGWPMFVGQSYYSATDYYYPPHYGGMPLPPDVKPLPQIGTGVSDWLTYLGITEIEGNPWVSTSASRTFRTVAPTGPWAWAWDAMGLESSMFWGTPTGASVVSGRVRTGVSTDYQIIMGYSKYLIIDGPN